MSSLFHLETSHVSRFSFWLKSCVIFRIKIFKPFFFQKELGHFYPNNDVAVQISRFEWETKWAESKMHFLESSKPQFITQRCVFDSNTYSFIHMICDPLWFFTRSVESFFRIGGTRSYLRMRTTGYFIISLETESARIESDVNKIGGQK